MTAAPQSPLVERRTIEEQIGATLANENGLGVGVAIWRRRNDPLGKGPEGLVQCTVGEFLSKPENQKGTWLIDGGWGGPPGPIHVRWNDATREWENGGFCGHSFTVDGRKSTALQAAEAKRERRRAKARALLAKLEGRS